MTRSAQIAAGALALAAAVGAAFAAPPNIILIQTDDQGYEDIDLLNSTEYLETPHLDTLASNAVVFTDFYCANLCAPSRASVLTGRHHLKTGVWGVHGGSDYLNLGETTFGEVLKAGGYKTGHLGKWHSGKSDGYLPWHRGFDEGAMAHLYQYYDNTLTTPTGTVATTGWVEERLADRAIDFITANQNEPFMLYYCPITAHTGNNSFDSAAGTTFHGPPDLIQKYVDMGLSGSDDMDKLARLYASIEFLDTQIGRIFQTLETLSLADDTIIIYMSDNGPAVSGNLKPGSTAWDTIRSPDGVLGNKQHILENGIRTYCLIKSPDFSPAVVSNVVTCAEDMFPTVLELAGFSVPPGNKALDGFSMVPLCETGTWTHTNRMVYSHQSVSYIGNGAEFELNLDRSVKRPQAAFAYDADHAAIRQGDFKVVSGDMYNIRENNHIEDTIITGGVESALETELERWWNDDIVMDVGSFTRPVFQIGWDGKPFSKFDLYPAWETSPSISINNHDCTGWSTVGDFVTLKVNVVTAGIYSPLVNWSGGSVAAGATARLTIGTDSADQTISNAWKETFQTLELLPGEQELTFEIISKTGSGGILDKLKNIELTYVGPLPEETGPVPVDPDATAETVNLFSNMRGSAADSLMYGQHAAFHDGTYADNLGFMSDCKHICGENPAVAGFDFVRSYKWSPTGTNNTFHQQAVNFFKQGGVCTFSWHSANPDPAHTGDGKYNDTSGDPVGGILDPTSQTHTNFNLMLDDIASFFNNLQVDGVHVPVIWRPFHENSGAWFWWGTDNCTPAEYIDLWEYTYHYLTGTCGVHNLLWAYSPSKPTSESEYLERYPGDSYVDLLGFDRYGDADGEADFFSNTLLGAQVVAGLALARGKLSAITESGERNGFANTSITNWITRAWLNDIQTDPVAKNISYVLTWRSPDWSAFQEGPNAHLYDDFINFYNSPFTVFEDGLPNLYGRSCTIYEAEDATLTGVEVGTVRSGYSGAGHTTRHSFTDPGDRIDFTVSVPSSGNYQLSIRYNAPNHKINPVDVNGTQVGNPDFPGTGDTWQTYEFGEVALNAGANTITIRKSWGWMDIDYIELCSVGAEAPTWDELYAEWLDGFPTIGNSTNRTDNPDGDAFNNEAEFIAGTDPTDPLSVFKVTQFDPDGFVIHWNSVSGRVYSIDWADDVTTGFSNIAENLYYPRNSYTDEVDRVESANFYRVNVRRQND